MFNEHPLCVTEYLIHVNKQVKIFTYVSHTLNKTVGNVILRHRNIT